MAHLAQSSTEINWEKRHSYSGRRYFINQSRARIFSKKVSGKVELFYFKIQEGDPGKCWLVTWGKSKL